MIEGWQYWRWYICGVGTVPFIILIFTAIMLGLEIKRYSVKIVGVKRYSYYLVKVRLSGQLEFWKTLKYEKVDWTGLETDDKSNCCEKRFKTAIEARDWIKSFISSEDDYLAYCSQMNILSKDKSVVI